jgi:hypothetical protein
MKVSIQFNGNSIALRIDGATPEERERTFARFYNHEAIDANVDEVERDACGAYIVTTTRAKFTKGIANWLQFAKETACGMEFQSRDVAAYFKAKAEKYILNLPQERIFPARRNLSAEMAS